MIGFIFVLSFSTDSLVFVCEVTRSRNIDSHIMKSSQIAPRAAEMYFNEDVLFAESVVKRHMCEDGIDEYKLTCQGP